MPDLFSPFTLKDVTLRNRIVMSPMTMYASVGGRLDDYHVSYLGARAAGGFALVFGEQMAITPDGRTTTSCAGIWDDDQVEGHARVCAIIERMGAVPAIQLGHTGRKGSELPPHRGTNSEGTWKQLPPDHPDGWTCVAPSDLPYGGGGHVYPVKSLTVDEIKAIHRAYADAARRALDAGYRWLEMHYAHGYLGASFFSPIANRRTDQYGGSVANRARFHLEALDAVRAVWPERYPLTMRLGSDDLNPAGTVFEDAVEAIGMMRAHGLDLADLSLGFNTDDMIDPPMNEPRLHAGAGEPGASRDRHPCRRQLEPRRAAQRRPGDPGRARGPGDARPSGAREPALAGLGRARTRAPRPVLPGAARLGVVAAELPRPRPEHRLAGAGRGGRAGGGGLRRAISCRDDEVT